MKTPAEMQDEIDELREELRQLKDVFLGRDLYAPAEWGLTIQQEQLAIALAKRGRLTHDQCMIAISLPKWGEKDRDPHQPQIIVYHIRRKIRQFGFTIKTVWGIGYSVDETFRAAFKETANG